MSGIMLLCIGLRPISLYCFQRNLRKTGKRRPEPGFKGLDSAGAAEVYTVGETGGSIAAKKISGASAPPILKKTSLLRIECRSMNAVT